MTSGFGPGTPSATGRSLRPIPEVEAPEDLLQRTVTRHLRGSRSDLFRIAAFCRLLRLSYGHRIAQVDLNRDATQACSVGRSGAGFARLASASAFESAGMIRNRCCRESISVDSAPARKQVMLRRMALDQVGVQSRGLLDSASDFLSISAIQRWEDSFKLDPVRSERIPDG